MRVAFRSPQRHGLGQAGFSVSGLAAAIQQMEGWYPGSLSYRNNNPGNLRPGSLAVGSTGSNGGYAVFPDYQTGLNALIGLIQSPGYWNLTLTQFFAKYAPSADGNQPGSYAASVASMLGVDANTPLSTLAAGGGPSAPSGGGDTSGGASASGDSGASAGGSVSSDASTLAGDLGLTDDSGNITPLAWGLGAAFGFLAVYVAVS